MTQKCLLCDIKISPLYYFCGAVWKWEPENQIYFIFMFIQLKNKFLTILLNMEYIYYLYLMNFKLIKPKILNVCSFWESNPKLQINVGLRGTQIKFT